MLVAAAAFVVLAAAPVALEAVVLATQPRQALQIPGAVVVHTMELLLVQAQADQALLF
jgi:hypothetical protein